MIRTCPFASGIDANGKSSLSPCVESCALRLNGECAFSIMAKKLSQIKADPTDHKPVKED